MNIQYVFARLERSDLLESFVHPRIESILEKFRRDRSVKARVRFVMENSPHQPGRDSFGFEILLNSRLFRGVAIRKRSRAMGDAIAQGLDALANIVSRTHEARTQRRRRRARGLVPPIALPVLPP